MYSPLNSYVYINWIFDFKYIIIIIAVHTMVQLCGIIIPMDLINTVYSGINL